ncbi:MAG: exo-alpha-sialidase [Chloroflexota bacterium]
MRGEAEAFPPALSAHLEALAETLPGNQGMAEEGPASAAEDAFMARAYPADTISVAEMSRARSAFIATSKRPFPRGKPKPGNWAMVGPSQALYPRSEFLTSFLYVPNAYLAGGRTTSAAIAQNCRPGDCKYYIATAGGGVWRTKNALADDVKWQYLGGPLGINATGTIAIDPNDPTANTIYAGTGEANICGSGCVAGTGIYKSTDGGTTWSAPIGQPEFQGKGVGQILIEPGDPNTLYVASTTALRGMSSVCCSGVTRPVPGAAKWGLYKSTDGGANWSFIHNGSVNVADCLGNLAEFNNTLTCSPRGVRHIAFDPFDTNTIYASSYARGVWRSTDAGATWTQIKQSLNNGLVQTRTAIAVTALPNGKTRMYVYEGNNGTDYSRLSRSDDVAAGAPVFTDLTSTSVADPGWAWFNLCGAQCWYDLFVYTPAGHPDIVYVGGSYSYGQNTANKRAVVLSTDAGTTGTDMTMDGTDSLHPNALHPDQHSLVTNPTNPFQFFETNDGGVMRSSGAFVDRSAWCDDPARGLGPTSKARCRQMLSRIPSLLQGLNKGLNTLQFQSLSVSPFNSKELQGGTQDNGTWENYGSPILWENTMIGDGGQSGFDIAIPEFRFHNFTGVSTDVNFNSGNIADWIWISDPITDGGTEFYAPVISDPAVAGTLFAGTGVTAYRTTTYGLGTMTREEANLHCNEWTGDFSVTCGDWARLGTNPLTGAFWGDDRVGSAVTAIERTAADTSTAWAATTRGRVFVSKDVDAADPSAVSWTRIDDDAVTPNRHVSSIFVDPENGNHAWISYNGFIANAPGGHIFEVTYHPGTGLSTWTDLSHDWGDLPATDVAVDTHTGDVYVSSDFGVSMLPAGTTHWVRAGSGMPNVEVAGLTILPAERILYAATHGLSAWKLALP